MSTSDERKRELDKIKEESKQNLKKVKEEERKACIERLREVKNLIKNNFVVKFEKQTELGGQHCGILPRTVIVKSEDLEIEIRIKHFRSDYQNRDLAILLMELAMDEIIK